MDKLWLNNEEIELDDNRAAFTFQMWDLRILENRQGTLSFGLKIPRSKTNERIIKNANVDSQTTVPYTRIPARYEAAGTLIIGWGGSAILEAAETKKHYSITLYGPEANFWEAIKDKKISEISNTDHYTWLLQEISANNWWDAFPFFDTHAEMPSGSVVDEPPASMNVCGIYEFPFLFPSLSFKELLLNIITDAGFQLADSSCLAWDDARLNKLIVPCTKKLPTATTALQLAAAFADTNVLVPYFNMTPYLVANTYALMPETTIIDNWVTHLYNDWNDRDGGGQSPVTGALNYRADCAGRYQIIAYCELLVAAGPGTQECAFNIFDIETKETLAGVHFTVPPSASDTTHNLAIYAGAGSQNRAIEITSPNRWAFSIYDAAWDPLRIIQLKRFYFLVDSVDPDETAYGYDYPIAINLPEMTQLQAIKAWVNMMGAMIWADEESKLIYVYKFSELYENFAVAEDWTDYLDRSQETEIRYRLEEWGQTNILKYGESEAYELTGQGSIFINDEALEKEVVKIELEFKATDDKYHFDDDAIAGGIPMAKVPYFTGGNYADPGPRLLSVDEITVTKPMNVRDAVYVWDTTRTSPKIAKADGTSFVDLIADNYDEIRDRVMNSTKIARAPFILPVSVIRKRKGNVPVFVKDFGAYFYVNKIENYTEGESCICELIKL